MKTEKICEYCGKAYIAGSKRSKYCSTAHRIRAHEKRNGKDAPTFLKPQKTIKPKSILKPFKTDSVKSKDSSIGQNSFALNTLQKLQNDRNYYLQCYYSIQDDRLPYATIGGAIVGSMMLGKENRTIGAIIGGLGGLVVDSKLIPQRTEKAQLLRQQLLHKISETDKQIELLKRTEIKDVYGLGKKVVEQKKVSDVINSSELVKQDIPVYDFIEPYSNFIGQPTQNFSAIIYGLPKSGKSNFSIQFASYLARHYGKVLYVASEEGLQSRTLIDKVKFNLADNREISFSGAREFEKIKEHVKGDNYKFVFIDSLNIPGITPEQLEELKKENSNKAFISILQSTKNGSFKGGQEFAHNADVVISVADGIASQIGRFNGASQMNIFPR